MTVFSLGHSGIRELRRVAEEHGAGEAELAGIDRLARGEAVAADVSSLAFLANLAGLPWRDLFPQVP